MAVESVANSLHVRYEPLFNIKKAASERKQKEFIV